MYKARNIVKLLVVPSILVAMIWATAMSAPQLDGAKVFRDNCTKCHGERSPMERTDKEWTIVTTHMRTIAGLTAVEARAVVKFLKENNGKEN